MGMFLKSLDIWLLAAVLIIFTIMTLSWLMLREKVLLLESYPFFYSNVNIICYNRIMVAYPEDQ